MGLFCRKEKTLIDKALNKELSYEDVVNLSLEYKKKNFLEQQQIEAQNRNLRTTAVLVLGQFEKYANCRADLLNLKLEREGKLLLTIEISDAIALIKYPKNNRSLTTVYDINFEWVSVCNSQDLINNVAKKMSEFV